MKAAGPAQAWRAVGWLAAALGCIAYAVLAHWAATSRTPGLFEALVFILPLMALALALAWRSRHRLAWVAAWIGCAAGLFAARDLLPAGTHWVMLAQHVGINMALCLGFGRTLSPGMKPLVSRMAELVHGDLSPRLVRYTRQVTWAWTLFFALTSLVSLLLFALAPAAVWSAFVNLLSLPLLGAMFIGEYLVRIAVIPRSERSGFLQAMAAYRQFSARKAKSE